MVYFKKSYPSPFSLYDECIKPNGSYKKDDVLEQLYNDFENKCYICESQGIESLNIEHFAPHKNIFPIRKYNWSNLFWACSHCNQIKSSTEPLLNCTVLDALVDEKIKYYIDDKLENNKIIIKALFNDLETKNTVKLLQDVYNGTTQQNKYQAREKRNRIYDELSDFTSFLSKYHRTENSKEKIKLFKVIEDELSNESAFTAFKRWIVRDNSYFYKEFKHYLKDN